MSYFLENLTMPQRPQHRFAPLVSVLFSSLAAFALFASVANTAAAASTPAPPSTSTLPVASVRSSSGAQL
jgi:hypothetical protein